jgi:hypothetical protein
MSKHLLIRPEANNAVTVLLDGVEIKLVRDGEKLLVIPPDNYWAEIGESGVVTVLPLTVIERAAPAEESGKA